MRRVKPSSAARDGRESRGEVWKSVEESVVRQLNTSHSYKVCKLVGQGFEYIAGTL